MELVDLENEKSARKDREIANLAAQHEAATGVAKTRLELALRCAEYERDLATLDLTGPGVSKLATALAEAMAPVIEPFAALLDPALARMENSRARVVALRAAMGRDIAQGLATRSRNIQRTQPGDPVTMMFGAALSHADQHHTSWLLRRMRSKTSAAPSPSEPASGAKKPGSGVARGGGATKRTTVSA